MNVSPMDIVFFSRVSRSSLVSQMVIIEARPSGQYSLFNLGIFIPSVPDNRTLLLLKHNLQFFNWSLFLSPWELNLPCSYQNISLRFNSFKLNTDGNLHASWSMSTLALIYLFPWEEEEEEKKKNNTMHIHTCYLPFVFSRYGY